MKIALSLILFIFCTLICPAQKTDEKAVINTSPQILRKQILVDEFDNRAKDIPFAAVRVFVRTRIAEWLWKKGKDETGRAEQLAVKAIEEIYEKPDEMPDSRSLKRDLFSLLEVNAKETANKLRTKYKIGSAEDLYTSVSPSYRKDNDKLVAEKVRNALTDTTDLSAILGYLAVLQIQKSPELAPLLAEIINIQDSGKNNFTTASFLWIVNNFKDSIVPIDLKVRFYKIILNRAKNALQTTDGGEIHFAYVTLFRILPDIKANAPELAADAEGLNSALSAKTTPGDREYQESYQRIEESANRLNALIAEAEKSDNKNRKYSYLAEASRLATKEGKFRLAVDLSEKAIEDVSLNASEIEFRLTIHDQQLAFITQDALQKDDLYSAEYAAKKIINDLKKADVLSQTAFYFIRNKDIAAARNAYDEALKLTLKADNDKSKIQSLFRLVSAASAIDQNQLTEIILITAKAINDIPTLNPEDKTGTENFKKYISTLLQTDFSLYVAVSNLTFRNKNEAVNFANQINQKEIRIAADLALAINTFESERTVSVPNLK